MENMTHWKKTMNPDYLGSYAFQPGEEKVVTIDSVQTETITGAEGKREDCLVAHFTDQTIKPMILNATNCKAVVKLNGSPYLENWHGTELILCVQNVKAFGEIVEAVRIRPVKPYACSVCGKAITGYGSMTHKETRDYTKQKYGAQMCARCAKERAEQK